MRVQTASVPTAQTAETKARSAVVLASLFMLATCVPLAAQNSNSDEEKTLSNVAAATEADAEDKPSEPKKFKGRLPRYYGQLGLANEQRNKIYSIQGKYHEMITALQKQLDALKQKRNKEIVQVLSTEQKERLDSLVLAYRNRRKQAAARTETANATDAQPVQQK